jgi:hypothetical protein
VSELHDQLAGEPPPAQPLELAQLQRAEGGRVARAYGIV